jgi:hypothetical protein
MFFLEPVCLLSAKHNQVMTYVHLNLIPLAQEISTVLISAKLLDIDTLMHDMHKNFYM